MYFASIYLCLFHHLFFWNNTKSVVFDYRSPVGLYHDFAQKVPSAVSHEWGDKNLVLLAISVFWLVDHLDTSVHYDLACTVHHPCQTQVYTVRHPMVIVLAHDEDMSFQQNYTLNLWLAPQNQFPKRTIDKERHQGLFLVRPFFAVIGNISKLYLKDEAVHCATVTINW